VSARLDQPSAAERSQGLWVPAHRALTIGLVLSTTFIATEALAVLTIMPRVAHQLGDVHLYAWVFSAFMLASVVGTVAAGREADRAGPARPFAAGVGMFALGLALAGAAPSMGVLILARAVQGLGAGAVPAVSYLAIGRSLEGPARARMLAVLASAWVLPGLVSPLLSALLASLLGWRWVFFGLIPLVAMAGVLALPALARLGPTAGERTDTRTGALHEGGQAREHSLHDALRTAGGAGLALAGLAAHELALAGALLASGVALGLPAVRRLLPAGTIAARSGLPATILNHGLLNFSFFGADAFITLAVTGVLHRSTTAASLVVTAPALTWALGAWLQARLVERWESRSLIRLGVLALLGGIAAMALSLRPSAPLGEPLAAWSVAGLGMGIAYSPGSLMMMRQVPDGREGWGSASLNLAEVLGVALGAGACGAVIVAASAHGASMSGALSGAFALAGLAAFVTLLLTGRLQRLGVRDAEPRDATASVQAPGRLASQNAGRDSAV
jgi:MFS family permease